MSNEQLCVHCGKTEKEHEFIECCYNKNGDASTFQPAPKQDL
jgi:hypothetical protein